MSALCFATTYRSFTSLSRYTGILLPWYNNEPAIKRRIFFFWGIIIIVHVAWKLICDIYAITHLTNIPELFQELCLLSFWIQFPAIHAFFGLSTKRFKMLTDSMDKMSQRIAEAGFKTSDTYKILYERDANILDKFMKVLMINSIFCTLAFVLQAPILGLLKGNYGARLAYPGHCYFEENIRVIYELMVILEFSTVVVPMLQKLMTDIIMLTLFKMHATSLYCLSQILGEIGDICSQDPKEAKEKLCLWIKLHQATLRNVQDMIDLLSPLIILYNVSIIAILAGSITYQIQSTEVNALQTTMTFIYVSVTATQFFSECYMADEVIKEGEKIAQAAYFIPWYMLDSAGKGFLKLIITMANRPHVITAYRASCFQLNKEVFVSFMTSTVSAFMAFSTLVEQSN